MTQKQLHSRPILIFTDLDGSLLNHHDYSYQDARPAIEQIQNHAIPLIICTSKTRHEVLDLRTELNLSDPFITENGGGVFVSENSEIAHQGQGETIDGFHRILLGKPYQDIRESFNEMKKRYPVKGFGDMDTSEIQSLTGLSDDQTAKAKQREFTEPFIIEHEDHLTGLEDIAHQRGLKIVKGGRFHHLISSEQDKGAAVRHVIEMYRSFYQQEIITIGAGDSMNDYLMLKSVMYPVLIPHPDGSFELMSLQNLTKAPFPGSKGWNAAIQEVLMRLNEI